MAKPAKFEEEKQDSKIIPIQEYEDFARRGWTHYSNGEFHEASIKFFEAIKIEPQADNYYALGMALRAEGKPDQAVKIFERVLELLEEGKEVTRTNMLKRLAKGQINFMTINDWNLEKEIWHNK